jgi:ArsR family transcriptional regulator, arsenate/arsenite/antimonite-responsive transcriptional repressor
MYRRTSMIDGHQFIGHHGDVTTQVLPVIEQTKSPCCEPLDAGRLGAEQATALAQRLKVLADPTRLRLLSMLLDSEHGEACTCDLVEPLGLSQPTVTHHLHRMAEAGIVHGEKRGRWTFYSVDKNAIETITDALKLGT